MPESPRHHYRDHLEGIEDFLRRGPYQLGPGHLKTGNGRAATPSKVFTEYATTYRGDVPLPTMSQFEALVQEIVDEETSHSQVEEQDVPNVDEWVQEQLDALQSPDASEQGALLQFDDASGTWTDGVGFPAPNHLVEALVLERFYHLRDEMPAIRTLWPKDRIQIVLAKILASYTSKTVHHLRAGLAYDREAEEGGRACLRWVLEDVLQVEEPDVAVEVLRHWIWQVKRYLYGLHVPSPLMVNILGPQGCGKSQLVTMLVGAPGLFGPFMETASLSTMGDSRDTDLFSSKLVIFFDELAFSSEYGDESRNIDAMKKILTSQYNSRRDLGKNSRSKMKRIFSAIAASNASIIQRIYDPTGMRRYFEIVVRRTARMTTEEHGRVFGEPTQALGSHPEDAMDPVLIWKSVDESRDMGYLVGDIRRRVESIQATYKKADLLEYILREDTGDIPHPYNGDNMEPLSALLRPMSKVADVRNLLEKAYPELEVVRLSSWRKSLHEWIKDHDQAQARFFPGHEGTILALSKMRIPVFQFGARQYLLVFRTFTDPDDAGTQPF